MMRLQEKTVGEMQQNIQADTDMRETIAGKKSKGTSKKSES